jgi:polysaccharide export outer membrane protein
MTRMAWMAIGGLAWIATASLGCKTSGPYVWADSLPRAPEGAQRDYILQAGDTITIRVWNQDSITTKVKIRPDGKVSLPFVSDIDAVGLTPTALATRIQSRMKEYIVNPVVTVVLEEPRPLMTAVIGEVAKPGNFQLEPGSGVLQAIATAGGMTPFADKDRIMVLRQNLDGSGTQRIRFTYSMLTQAEGRASTFRLEAGDVVVVE